MQEIKSFPFPVLSADNTDYADGVVYEAVIRRIEKETAVTVRHKVNGDCWLANSLDKGDAVFACIVSLPSTMYRRVDVACESQGVVCDQRIDYTDSGYGEDLATELPMFRPVIIAKNPIKQSAAVGLSELWQGAEFDIPQGGIIAYGEWERFGSASDGLMFIEKSDNLRDGAILVEESQENGFRFRVSVGGDKLFGGLQDPLGDIKLIRRSVLIHALSSGFAILKERYQHGWEEYVNLRLIADRLEREGVSDWTDPDFSAEKAATTLYPHLFPANEEGQENGD